MPPPASTFFWKKVDENQVSHFIWPNVDVTLPMPVKKIVMSSNNTASACTE